MKYLAVKFHPEKIAIQTIEHGEITSEAKFPLDKTSLTTELSQITETVRLSATGIAGGIFSGEFNAQTHENTYIDADGKAYDLAKLFSEITNKPFLHENEAAKYRSMPEAFAAKAEAITWNLDYVGYEPGKEEYSIESLLTIGNGFLGLRGTSPEMEQTSGTYPATYIAGLYNQAESVVADTKVVNEDFVNNASASFIGVKIASGEVLTFENVTVKDFTRKLDLQTGLFQSRAIVEDPEGRQLEWEAEKVANMAKMNEYAIRYTVRPLNFSAPLTVVTTLDGTVENSNVERYRSLNSHHYDVLDLGAEGNTAFIHTKTTQSQIEVLQKTTFSAETTNAIQSGKVMQATNFDAALGESYTFEKRVEIYADHQQNPIDIKALKAETMSVRSFADIFAESSQAWQTLWDKADITVEGDMMSQKLLRLHTYHLLVASTPFSSANLDVSITARGLHGEAYRGHIFWDEIFILPFYIYHFPETAKQLLLYRYNRLAAAKESAARENYDGAMFPWQSGHDGTEQTQLLHLNPMNGEWGDDYSRLQRHVSLAIAYNVWLYDVNTDDQAFMENYGIEMFLEIAEFWKSTAVFNESTQRYDIPKVMGPDEFHEAYPDSKEGGLTNNAYTNMMVVWLFEEVADLQERFDSETFAKILAKVGLTEADLENYEKIKHQLQLEINDEGIIAQYEGYFDLKEIDWDAYKEKYGNIYRMDRILKAEGKSADDYKVSKQADTLMTFYNLDKQHIDEIIRDLDYQLPDDYLEKNLEYYLQRTSHGSTLSRIVHAELAEMVGQHALSWKFYQEALYSDYNDIQGGTTAEGIHTGVMSATLHVTLATYAGVDIRKQQLSIQPRLPEDWTKIAFQLVRRGVNYQFEITKETIMVTASATSNVLIHGKMHQLPAGEQITIAY